MLKTFSALLAILCMVLGTATNAQQSADMTTLFAQLGDPTTTDRAFHQILEASRKDPAERASAMRRLPSIIEKNQGNRPWVNSVTLTGKLKAENAIPALIEVLPRSSDTPSIIVGFADSSTLRNDTVGKALCEIGDPTVPALADILKSSDSQTRRRVARILWNMDTAASRKVLMDHMERETDPGIKQVFGIPKAK